MAVSIILKKKRKERGWTQEQLAQRSGVSQQAISFIESERNTPSEGTLRLLAQALDCSVSELLGEKKEPAEHGRLDEALIDLLVDLSPDEAQRVKDFVAGIKAGRTT